MQLKSNLVQCTDVTVYNGSDHFDNSEVEGLHYRKQKKISKSEHAKFDRKGELGHPVQQWNFVSNDEIYSRLNNFFTLITVRTVL